MKDKNNNQDKSKPFSKRADPDIRLEIASPSEEVHQIVENDDQRKLELKRKRARDYNAKFTKKAEEEARKTLSKEEFEKVQERNKIFRAKRNKYVKAENARIKAGKLAGDEKSTKRYEHTMELKKKLYRKKSIGAFLGTGLLIEKSNPERRGKDDDLKELLERPLNFEARKEVERRLKHRQRGRELFKKNLDLVRKGDPKALDWHKNRKKSNREYMQRYRSEKEKAKLMNNENPPS